MLSRKAQGYLNFLRNHSGSFIRTSPHTHLGFKGDGSSGVLLSEELVVELRDAGLLVIRPGSLHTAPTGTMEWVAKEE